MPNQVFDDAQFVLRYATARGLLPDNALPNAIAQAEQRLDVHGNLPLAAEPELSTALNASAKLILPMTIDRLRAEQSAENLTGWERTAYVSWAYVTNLFTPVVVFALCVLWIALIVPLTTSYNRVAGFVTELRETEKEDFISLVEDAITTKQSLDAIKPRVNAAAATPSAPAVAAPPPSTTPPARPGARPAAAARPVVASATTTTLSPEKKAEVDRLEADLQKKWKVLRDLDSKMSINTEAIGQTVDINTGAPRLRDIVLSTYNLPSPPITRPAPRCDEKRTAQICAVLEVGAGNGLSTIAPAQIQDAFKARRQAESLNALLGSSILPVLYGLLGATVFLLRGYLGEGDPSGVARRPLAATAFLRLGLGGIAGLAIGWFWVPKAGVENTFANTPFALAFLAGFSIELLFLLLDRLLNSINPNASQPRPS